MTPGAFDALALSLTAATMNVQWGADQVYKVGGKMFAVLGPDEEWRSYLSTAHALTAAKLTRKARADLGLG
jgi:predicted DNA-binding protein (MmcQ/YjbR family)